MNTFSSALIEPNYAASDRAASTLRVTHVVVSLDTGGLERIVIDLLRFGLAGGNNPSVICLERPGNLASQVESLGIPLFCVNKRPGLRFSTVSRLRSLFKELQPDVVHTHQIGALLYAGPAARRERIAAVVHTEHINNVAKSRSLNRRIRTRLLWRLAGTFADRFCCVAEDIAAEARSYRTVPEKKLSVVLNGIDTAAFNEAGDTDSLRRELKIPPPVPPSSEQSEG